MPPAEEITAEKIMDTDPVTATDEESLAQVKSTMEENRLRAIPIVDDKNRLKGIIGYRDLVRNLQFNPETTSIEKAMHQPPEFDLKKNLIEVCDLRINSGRKMLVNLNGEKLNGVIGDREFLNGLEDAEDLEEISSRTLSQTEVITASENESLEKARHRMLDENISRLPVLDEGGDLTGILDSIKILQAMVPLESPDPGGTAGDRHGTREINISGGYEKDQMSQITVDQLMEYDVLTLEDHIPSRKAAEKMAEKERMEIVFTDGRYPTGILTIKDLIEHVADLQQVNAVLVQLTGVEVPEEKAAVHDQIKRQLQGSLGRKLQRPEELTLRIKKSEKDGKKHRYEIDFKLYSEYGLITVNEDGWDLLEVVDEGLNEMNRIVRDKKDQRSDHRKK